MRLNQLSLECYRNIREAQLTLHPQFNVIVGENGQGKTNLLSAVYWLATLTSLRSGRLRDLILWGERVAIARGESALNGLNHKLEVSTDGHKSYPKREGKTRTNRDYFGALSVISFTPSDLELVRGSPEVRRRFLDRAIFNEQHSHLDAVLRYQRALSSRNAFLRDRASDQLLSAYEATLAEVGARLMISRATYIERLSALYRETLYNICQFNGSVTYKPSISVSDLSASSPQSVQQQLMMYWEQQRESDRNRGFTQRGPHGDDITLKLNERSARSFASQGQQRAIALALKISQIENLSERLRSRPVLLLDDVSSELDRGRSTLLFEFLRSFEGQVLLTTTHEDYVPITQGVKVHTIHAGQVT